MGRVVLHEHPLEPMTRTSEGSFLPVLLLGPELTSPPAIGRRGAALGLASQAHASEFHSFSHSPLLLLKSFL